MATNKNFTVKNGITVGSTSIVNSSGEWVGPNSGLVGATGPTGPAGANGATGAIPTWSRVTSTFTATSGSQYIADTTSGSFTINLPSSPTTGTTVVFTDGGNWGTNNLIIGRNGSTIETDASDLTLDIPDTTVQMTYDGSTWQVVATVGGQGATGPTGATGVVAPWTNISANTTLSGNTQYIANTSAGTFYATLPSSPNIGTTIMLTDGANWGTYPLVVLAWPGK